MDTLKNQSQIEEKNLLAAVNDIESFMKLSKTIDSDIEIFKILNGLADITARAVEGAGGTVVKYIGDSTLMIFPEDMVDRGVRTLYQLKRDLEKYFTDLGYKNRVSFALHFGQAAVGYLGNNLDVIGDMINTVFMMKGQSYRTRFIISPQVFRKLKPDTRRIFHKYTPPIAYIAD